MSRSTDLAWAAGVIDGEGCISLTRRLPKPGTRAINPSYRLILKVTMCHRPTVERLQKVLGRGTIQHQKAQQTYWTDSSIWFCNATDAGACLRDLRKYLLTKAEEADAALEFLEMDLANRGGKGGSQPTTAGLLRRRETCWRKLRNLKSCNRSKDRKKEFLASQ